MSEVGRCRPTSSTRGVPRLRYRLLLSAVAATLLLLPPQAMYSLAVAGEEIPDVPGMMESEDPILAEMEAAAAADAAAVRAAEEQNTAADDNAADGSSSSSSQAKPQASTTEQAQRQQQERYPDPEKDWGHYYDPKSEFCGKYDCYKILGFNYEDFTGFGRTQAPPSAKEITQSYRTLSRRWHPDKNRGVPGVEERFVKINKAYEVLTSKKRRAEYDLLRDNPDEYIARYGSNVLFHYAPKSDVTIVALILLVLGSVFTWFVQKQKWQSVADRLVKASLDGLGPREGGTEDSLEIRERALEILAERREEEKEREKRKGAASANGANSSSKGAKTPSPSKKKGKLTKKELKEQENEELRPIVEELVNEIKDFGVGFHQPTWRDLFVVKIVYAWPVQFGRFAAWQLGYWGRRLRKLELNEDERRVLTRRAMGEVTWHTLTDEDREEAMTEDLWISKNLEDWREMQEVKKLGKGYQKRYNRWKKKQGSKLE